MRREALDLGSTGRWPVAFGSLAECMAATTVDEAIMVRGKLPRTTGWQPVLPRITA